MALSVEKLLRAFLPRVSQPNEPELRGIAPSGVRTFLPGLAPEAILRPSKIKTNITGAARDYNCGMRGLGRVGRPAGQRVSRPARGAGVARGKGRKGERAKGGEGEMLGGTP